MYDILTRRYQYADTDMGGHHVMIKSELRVIQLQTKKYLRLLIHHQKVRSQEKIPLAM